MGRSLDGRVVLVAKDARADIHGALAIEKRMAPFAARRSNYGVCPAGSRGLPGGRRAPGDIQDRARTPIRR